MTIVLLYEAPVGIAIFSFDGDYLNDPAKSLKEFVRNETVPSPVDIANNAIDDHLAKRLTDLCGYEKKLVVGCTECKVIIGEQYIDHDLIFQGITCLHVDVPDCEMRICTQKKPMHTLLPKRLSDPTEDSTIFLHQHDITCNLETTYRTVS
ncbi:unnamed protein product [Triticum turgidum subsp. durum]|uniref:Uncharacterized protein n=1 Tax=Triticum turgidum subsp. durum TaxID=4567 RepID=A0A9R1ABS3_TRITD|nr:unnamed protein product [Triticum turgidum subsp. durum]